MGLRGLEDVRARSASGRVVALSVAAGAAMAVAACSSPDSSLADASALGGPDGDMTSGLAVGQACGSGTMCRGNLSCGDAGTCMPCGCIQSGAPCILNDECSAGLFCGATRTCEARPTGDSGDAGGAGASGSQCSSDGDCASGLRCNLVGLSQECQPEGMVDVGGACSASADCLGGLSCTSTGDAGASTCQANGPPTLGSAWPGVTCADVAGPTLAYFQVPRGINDGDFYRLPFPNDVRRDSGKLNLAGHPTPGVSPAVGYDLVGRWISDLSSSADGFSAYPTVFFRFSAAVDIHTTLKQKDAIRWVDVTTPTSAQPLGLGWQASTAGNAYICNNWVGVRPPLGQPLTPGHTYAVLVMTSVVDASQNPISVAPDLTALLAPTAPMDAALSTAWPKYAPLRAWASATGLATSSILDATVFTVGHVSAIGPKLAAAVAAAAAPTVTSWVRCGDAPSPCPQATGDRACGAPSASFDELHALVSLPIFQHGTEPYATPDQGGDLVLASDGTPQLQGSESVCMSLTVPKGGAMPSGGWPLLVYAHGTGGSFRSAITEGVAARASSIDDGHGGQVHVAVLGIDQVEHGPRRGASQDSPNNLFYNFANPLAARGNTLQGAADQMALVRLASTFDLTAAVSPTGAEIKFARIAFWGHSQGASAGGIAMPYVSGVVGAVLSGEGAGLIDALLHKQNPINIAAALPFALQETPGNVSEFHPVLALLQNDLDPDDPLNHAVALVASPVAVANQKHVFQPYGQGDTYAPPITEQTFAIAAQLSEAALPAGVMGAPAQLVGASPLPVPVGGNATVMSAPITAVVRQYAPSASYDGHFVSFDNAAAEADVDHFIADALGGGVPQVGR